MLNRSVIKRCVMAGVLVVPGAFFANRGTSIGLAFSSAIFGCVVMVIASLPLVLLTSSASYTKMISREEKAPIWQYPAIPAVISATGVAIGIVHGTILAPPSFVHLAVLVPLAAIAIWLTMEATKAPLPAAKLICIDAITMPSGLLYGAIAGATGFPVMLVAGGCAIACLLIARGMIVRLENPVGKPGRSRITWYVVLSASVVLMLVALLVVPATVPMVYPALASCGFAGSTMILASKRKLDTGSRAMGRRLISIALFCAVLAIFAGRL